MMKNALFMLAMLTCIFASCSSGGNDDPINPTPKPEEVKAEITIDSSIVTNGLSFDVASGEQSVSFSTNTNWTLSVASTTSGATWCKASATSGSKGSANVKFTVDENTGYDDRSVSVTIKAGSVSKTFTITQKGVDALLVTTNKYEVAQEGGRIEVEVKANVDYQLVISESAKDWITEANGRALTTHKHTFEIALNEESEKREGEITFKSGDKVEVVKVYQAGGAIILLSQNEYAVSDVGDTISVEVKSNVEFGVQMPDVDWIFDETSSRGMSSHTLKYIIAPNEGYDNRSAEIVFYDKNSEVKDTLKVVQAQKDAIVISQKEFNVNCTGDTIAIEIKSNINYEIKLPEVDWIKETQISKGLSSRIFYIIVSPNLHDSSRSADIHISNSNDNIVDNINILQRGIKGDGSLVVKNWKEDNPAIYANGGETVLTITSNLPWNASIVTPESNEWLDLDIKNNNQTTGILSIKTSTNNISQDRNAQILIWNENDAQIINIIQRQNIYQRIPLKERSVRNFVTLEYDKMTFNKMIVFLPIPENNIYQDVSQWKSDNGEVMKVQNGTTKYLRRTIFSTEIPKSGESILSEDFTIKSYHVYTNLDAVTLPAKIDKYSDIYSKYTGQNGKFIVPDNGIIKGIADKLWKESSENIISYARLCYEYVAGNMKYLNANTGLHPLDKILSDGGGDCGNQASVFISLLRNKEIPARHVVMFRTDNTYHVRSEFYLAGYGWIPVDVNAKNLNPSGDYFGKVESDEIVANFDVNLNIELEVGNNVTVSLLQTYAAWCWWSSPAVVNFYHFAKEK